MRKALFMVAVAIFIVFVAVNAYPILFPIHRWHVDCFITNRTGGKVFAPRVLVPDQRKADGYAVLAERRGETCHVTPVRELYREFQSSN
jgi:hypothetical protein